MKTRHLLALLSVLLLGSNQLFAIDRIVQQSGPAGTYPSISSAITAAIDGDVIVVNNKDFGLPWSENLTINKSLTIVSAVDNVQWYMSGNISIAQGEGRVVSLVGMRNTLYGASITKTGSMPTNRMTVNIVGSDITPNIGLIYVNLNLISCKVSGTTSFSFGRIIGNELLEYVEMYSDLVSTEDINFVVGNKISAVNGTAFYTTSTTQYLYFGNNYVRSTTAAANSAVSVAALKTGLIGNRISNCSIACSYPGASSHGARALSVNFSGSGQLIVENSILAANYVNSTTGGNSVYVGSGSSTTSFMYCMYYNPFIGGTTLPAANQNFSSNTAVQSNFNTSTGVFSGTANINAGNPINTQLDLNLTRNDIGAYGSSNSLENFIPFMNNPMSSRVGFVTAPRVVSQGGTMTITAIGFDK